MTPRSRMALPFTAILTITLLVAAALGTTAGALPNKPFSADVLPSCVGAGSKVTFTITLRNETTTQQLGSANVTPPTGFTLVSTTPPATLNGNVLELRNLGVPPGGSTTATFQATTPSTPSAYNWNDPAAGSSIIAKQSNDFNGSPGNDLTFRATTSHVTTFVGTCVLAFVTQAQHANVDENITAVSFTPTGTPVSVEVQDGFGHRVTTFSGSISLSIVLGTGATGAALVPATPNATATAGLASFDASQGTGFSIDTVGLDYRIRASAGAGVAPVDSVRATGDPGFDIASGGALCTGPGCNGHASSNGVSVTVTAPNAQAGDVIEIALDVEALSCEGYTPLAGTPVVTFEVTGSSYRIVTIRVPAALATRPASQDRVCYSSALPFTDRFGNENVTTGLLPDIKNRTPISQPAQYPTEVDRATGDHIVSFRAPPGATRGKT